MLCSAGADSAASGDGVQRGTGDVPGDQLADAAVQRGREEHPLAAGRGLVEEPGDRGQEAEVGHVVGLVEHGDLDAGERAGAPLDQVGEPAGVATTTSAPRTWSICRPIGTPP